MRFKVFLGIVVLLALIVAGVQAETWTVVMGAITPIEFTFESDTLSLSSTEALGTFDGSSGNTLLFSGEWAVCGSAHNGNLIRDPYATFRADGTGGHISWAADTPIGHTTNLLLGYDFTGNSAQSYSGSYWSAGIASGSIIYVKNHLDPVNGTLVTVQYRYSFPQSPPNVFYTAQQHSFAVTYAQVPEPSSVVCLVSGLLGIGGFALRMRR